jgi:L-iditol 2-dehydrogenase
MKALRKLDHGPGLIEVQELPKPKPGPGEVLLQIKRAGVCFTDIHIWHGEFPKLKPPVTLCHECCGVVAEMGPGVEGFKPGDRVTSESEAFSCGECRFCKDGLNQLCDERTALGYATDGAFAQYMKVRASALHRLPDNVSFTAGAVSEPLAVGVHAVMEIGRIQPGEWVLVTGPGTIGLIVMQVVRALGAKAAITGMARDAPRLELAQRLGAEHCIRAESGDQFKLAAKLNQGYGFDSAIECSGSLKALDDAIKCVRKGGRIMQLGLAGQPGMLNLDELTLKEITLEGCFAHNNASWKKSMELLATGKIDLESLVAGEAALEEWEQVFQKVEAGQGLKFLLNPEL